MPSLAKKVAKMLTILQESVKRVMLNLIAADKMVQSFESIPINLILMDAAPL